MDEAQKKQVTPPYMSLPQLEKLIDLVSSRNLAELSLGVFRGYGFNAFDASVAGATLKFLGLADDQNRPTPKMAKLRLKGEARKKAFEEIVKGAYKKLFDSVEEPYKLPPDELSNEMVVQYGATPRIVRSAVPAFLKFCEYAGLIEEGTIVSRKVRARGEPRRDSNNHAKATKPKTQTQHSGSRNMSDRSDGDFHVQVIVKGKMTIAIPDDVFYRMAIDDDMNDAWRKVLKAAHAFANEYVSPLDLSSGDEEKEGDS